MKLKCFIRRIHADICRLLNNITNKVLYWMSARVSISYLVRPEKSVICFGVCENERMFESRYILELFESRYIRLKFSIIT